MTEQKLDVSLVDVLPRGSATVTEPTLVLTASGAEARRYGPIDVLLVSADGHDDRVYGSLTRAGCRVASACAVSEAASHLISRGCTVVVCAEHLPAGAWSHFREQLIAATTGMVEFAFIVLLNSGGGDRIARVVSSGAADALVRPVAHEQLLRSIQVVHARAMRAREVRAARTSNPRSNCDH